MFERQANQMTIPLDAKFDKLVPIELVAENSMSGKCEPTGERRNLKNSSKILPKLQMANGETQFDFAGSFSEKY
jgi:hypothetical protein